MKQFHTICGTPRSGSTLLCNILNQNPDFHASSTSGLCQLLVQMQQVYTNAPEFKSLSINDKEDTEQRIKDSMRSTCESWMEGKIYFNKARSWTHNAILLREIFPDSKIICLVRDLREIFASVEKAHQNSAIWEDAATPMDKSLAGRAEQMFAQNGLIGQNVLGIHDLIDRKIGQVLFIRFNDFVSDPETAMAGIHNFIGLDSYEYDLKDIKDTATDVDALYGYKFPHHNHSGGIRPPVTRGWESVISDQIAERIVNLFPDFFKTFKYL